jgi:Protein of unknown function (DUF1565)
MTRGPSFGRLSRVEPLASPTVCHISPEDPLMDSAPHRFTMPAIRPAPGVASHAGRSAPRRTGRLLARFASASVIAAMAALLLVVAPVAAASPTLYVSPTGNDAGACTYSAPCKTIGQAITNAAPGSTIIVRRGTYHEAVVIPKQLHLVGHHAVINVKGIVADLGSGPLHDQGIIGWGVLIVGPGSAGTSFKGFTVKNAPAEGILAALTAHVRIARNVVKYNDRGGSTTFDPQPFECQAQGPVPGDCGEAIHLMSVTDSKVLRNRVHDNVGGILLTDEAGPNHDNLVAYNVIRNNKEDCGITLPSHNPDAMSDPTKGGVYHNTIFHNISTGNGGAGVGMFAAAEGMASYNNLVIANVLRNNGEAGVAIHSHTGSQNVSGNVIVANTISGNGVDPDFQSTPRRTGISIGSVSVPVHVLVARNWIANEYWGIFRSGPITVTGLHTNSFHGVRHHIH